MHFRPRFWVFQNFWGFWVFHEIFWVRLCEIVVIWSCVASSIHYNNVSCICWICAWLNLWVLLGLDWVFPMILLIFACHMFMHSLCIRSFLFFSILNLCCVSFCSLLSLSLSLSYRTSLCTPSIYRALVVSVLGRCLEMSLSLTFVGNLLFGVVF